MGKYITSDDVWKRLGSDAYTKVRSEAVGTGNDSTTDFSLDHDNLVSGSHTISESITTGDLRVTGSISPDATGFYNLYSSDGSQVTYEKVDTPKYYLQGLESSNKAYLKDVPSGVPSNTWTKSGAYAGTLVGTYTSSTGVTGTAYCVSFTTGSTLDLDDGELAYNTAPPSGSVITADYNYADVPDSEIQSIINQAEEEAENRTGRSFDLQTSSEYIDVDNEQTRFWLKNYPIVSMVSLSSNTATSVTDTPSWSASTEGLGNDYLMDDEDMEIGTFEYIDNKPLSGQKRLYATYSHGHSTIPDIVKELNILLAIRKMVNSTTYRAIFKGRDNFNPARLEEMDARIDQITGMLRKQNMDLI